MEYISLAEWAEREGLAHSTARAKANRGVLKTAIKVGRNWLIHKDEKNLDYRRAENKRDKK